MDKGIKQRLLGGIVLVAGAILLLPYVIENAGTGLPPRPQIPAHPVVPAADDMAPKLDQQKAELNGAIDEAHSDQNFYPVSPPASSAAAVAVSAPAAAPVVVAPTPLPVPDEVPPDATPPVVAQQAVAAKAAAATAQALAQAKADKAAAVAANAAAAQAQSKADKAAAKAAKAAAAKAAKEADVMADQEAARAMAVSAAVDMPATPRKPADTDTPGTAEAWQVQVASLGTEEKANQLVAKLRKKGYHASARASGQYWKVTVGPELAKDMADSMRQKLASDPGLKLSGWVQPYRP